MRGYARRLVECISSRGEGPLLGLTGAPGVGKSTIFSAIVNGLRSLGCRVGGIAAPEVRDRGRRVGFKIVNIMTGEEGWLAKRGSPRPGAPRIGSYYVVVDDALRVGVEAIRGALREAHVIGIDEVGPMELALPELREEIARALKSGKPKLVVYHRRLHSSDPDMYRLIAGGCTVEVTLSNRDELRAGSSSIAEALAAKAGCG